MNLRVKVPWSGKMFTNYITSNGSVWALIRDRTYLNNTVHPMKWFLCVQNVVLIALIIFKERFRWHFIHKDRTPVSHLPVACKFQQNVVRGQPVWKLWQLAFGAAADLSTVQNAVPQRIILRDHEQNYMFSMGPYILSSQSCWKV